MNNKLNFLGIIALVALIFVGCDKADDLPFYDAGNAPELTSSAAIAAPALSDSSNNVITFNWTSPKYSTDTSSFKYVLEIDSAGKSFASPIYTKTLTSQQSLSLKGAEITEMIIAAGLNFNTLYDFDVRIKSSYANNNDLLYSNKLRVKMSAYVTPPKIGLPASGKLFLVGDATQGGWNNPVPTPSQEFGKIDSVTYVGVFNLISGSEFLVLPINGDWANKYSLVNNSLPGANQGGDFGYNNPQNFKGPSTAGWYKITLDFQKGKYSIVPYVGAEIPSNLFIVGDATPGGWNNPVPEPAQKFTRLNSVQFVLNSIALNSGSQYLLLPENGSWSNKYSVTGTGTTNPLGDYFGYNRPDNFPAPTASGNYKMEINFGIQKKNAAGVEEANTAWFKNTKL